MTTQPSVRAAPRAALCAGDGATVRVDLALPMPGVEGAAGLGEKTFHERVVSFFHPTHPKYHQRAYDVGRRRGHGHGHRRGTMEAQAGVRAAAAAAQMELAAAAAGEAAAAEEAGGGQPAAPAALHCYWCYALAPGPAATHGRAPSWGRLELDGQVHRFCAACRIAGGKGRLAGARPAAAHCPGGCGGCANWAAVRRGGGA
eukprot:scaffold14.g1182.t1